MNLNNASNAYLMMMYVYLKSYEEAIKDFEAAIKDGGYADVALMAVKQKYEERIEKVANEVAG